MKNRWTDIDARRALDQWGEAYGPYLALRLYSARLIGSDPNLVLHGGGNVSVKDQHQNILGERIEAIYVKGSGRDLAHLQPDDLPGLDLAYLRKLRSVDDLTDAAMANELRTHLFDASAPTPSIETLVHAFLPHRFVDHSHADAVLVLTNQPDGAELVQQAVGDRVAVLPYITPGFPLAQAVLKVHQTHPDIDAIVLCHHGLITFADEARSAYQRHIELVDRCESFAAKRTSRRLTVTFTAGAQPHELAARVAPLLRGALAQSTGDQDQPHRRSVLEWRAGETVLRFVNSNEAEPLSASGPLTGDHLVRTKARPLLIRDPQWKSDEELSTQITSAVERYRRDYRAYVVRHGGNPEAIDPSPSVVLLPGAGVFCWGRTKHAARMAADITEHTLVAKERAHEIGTFVGLPSEDIFHCQYRPLQQAKNVKPSTDRPLDGQVVIISGGAGAIGTAIADRCVVAGAHAVLTDLDEEACTRAAGRIEKRHGSGTACGIVMDVRDEGSVAEGFAAAARAYGGVDIVVPNAGIAHVAPIDELKLADFHRVLAVNTVGCFLFMREGARLLQRQGLGGHVIINASKNVFAPGKDFAAYSASKAAGHQLGKVAALEWAPLGIAVNMINADGIFGDEDCPSGLWAEVGAKRAAGRGISASDLPEYYRNRNLLKLRVTGRHVGNAVVFFAANETPTTGATLPIDGGIAEAFPR